MRKLEEFNAAKQVAEFEAQQQGSAQFQLQWSPAICHFCAAARCNPAKFVGEEKAQSCDNAWYQELTDERK